MIIELGLAFNNKSAITLVYQYSRVPGCYSYSTIVIDWVRLPWVLPTYTDYRIYCIARITLLYNSLSCIFLLLYEKIVVKTQRNSTHLNSTKSNSKSNFVGLDSVATWNPPHTTHPHTNFSVTSRQARELKFGTETH